MAQTNLLKCFGYIILTCVNNFQVDHPRCVCVQQYQVEYRQVVKYTTDFIRCKKAIIDYMFRPFFIRPSSGPTWRSKEELVQLHKVQNVFQTPLIF